MKMADLKRQLQEELKVDAETRLWWRNHKGLQTLKVASPTSGNFQRAIGPWRQTCRRALVLTLRASLTVTCVQKTADESDLAGLPATWSESMCSRLLVHHRRRHCHVGGAGARNLQLVLVPNSASQNGKRTWPRNKKN